MSMQLPRSILGAGVADGHVDRVDDRELLSTHAALRHVADGGSQRAGRPVVADPVRQLWIVPAHEVGGGLLASRALLVANGEIVGHNWHCRQNPCNRPSPRRVTREPLPVRAVPASTPDTAPTADTSRPSGGELHLDPDPRSGSRTSCNEPQTTRTDTRADHQRRRASIPKAGLEPASDGHHVELLPRAYSPFDEPTPHNGQSPRGHRGQAWLLGNDASSPRHSFSPRLASRDATDVDAALLPLPPESAVR